MGRSQWPTVSSRWLALRTVFYNWIRHVFICICYACWPLRLEILGAHLHEDRTAVGLHKLDGAVGPTNKEDCALLLLLCYQCQVVLFAHPPLMVPFRG